MSNKKQNPWYACGKIERKSQLFTFCITIVFAAINVRSFAQTSPELGTLKLDSVQIEEAISEGVAYLKSTQRADGSWAGPSEYSHAGGETALAALALLSAGESHQSPAIQKAVAFLKAGKSRATYDVSLRAALYGVLPQSVARRELAQDLRVLQTGMINLGPSRGLYTYQPSAGGEQYGDLSNSQYGVLGVWYAADAGLEVPLSYWQRIDRAWREAQNDDGGWGYRQRDARSYQSMTVAGFTTVSISQDYLQAANYRPPGAARQDESERRALAWLANHFRTDVNSGKDTRLPTPQAEAGADQNHREPSAADEAFDLAEQLAEQQRLANPLRFEMGGTYVHYMLFGIERLGEATGLTRFGRHEWYPLGSAYLTASQRRDGSWQGTFSPAVDTAFSILFLTRGRSPVLLQKLQFGDAKEEAWNNRPRDAAAIVKWMRRQTERHLNWQVLSADEPAERWRQSPLLLMASHKPPELTPAQKGRLRDYLLQGGTLLASADAPAFATAIEQLGTELFPGLIWQDAPDDHPLLKINFQPPEQDGTKVRILGTGLRELIVLLPSGEPSWRWQSAGGRQRAEASPYWLPGNLHLMVTERSNPRNKGDDWYVTANPKLPPPAKISSVGRLVHSGMWNPEPFGFVSLAAEMHNRQTARLNVLPVSADASLLEAFPPVLHVTSVGPILTSDWERMALRQYMAAGGKIILEPAGGDASTYESLNALAQSLIGPDANGSGAEKPKLRPVSDSFWQSIRSGLTANELRRAAQGTDDKDPSPKPLIYSVDSDTEENWGIMLFRYDLSAGLVGYAREGLPGYTPAAARRILAKLIDQAQ